MWRLYQASQGYNNSKDALLSEPANMLDHWQKAENFNPPLPQKYAPMPDHLDPRSYLHAFSE